MQEKKSGKEHNFPVRLKAARLRSDLTQEELAAALGVTKGHVGNWEAGENMPGPASRRKLREFFGDAMMAYLFGETDDEPEKYPAHREEPLVLGEVAGGLSPETRELVRQAARETGLTEGEIVEICVNEKINEVGRRALLLNPRLLRGFLAGPGGKEREPRR